MRETPPTPRRATPPRRRRRRPTVCAQPGCPNVTPCPLHTPKPWETSGRRQRVGKSGWEQQRNNARTIRRHRGICHVCRQPGADEVDHVVPLAEGGTDDEANRRPIHAVPCHRDKTLSEARRARGVG